jgi:hypothetical protein
MGLHNFYKEVSIWADLLLREEESEFEYSNYLVTAPNCFWNIAHSTDPLA